MSFDSSSSATSFQRTERALPTSGLDFNPLTPNSTLALLPTEAEWSSDELTAYRALLAVNSISIVCCLMVIVGYFLMRRWHPKIMRRLSLKLVACMAGTELILHVTNLVGYGKLPTDSFVCGLMGGFFFACCSLTSLFYATAVALNCQLVFVFAKRPGPAKEPFFIYGPPALALVISLPTLASGLYGYDAELQYCWYATEGVSYNTVLLRMLVTFGGWGFLVIAYLIVAIITIIRAVFSPHSKSLQISATQDGFAAPSQTTDVISHRKTAVRRLVIRLLGFISVPAICVITGVVLDILVKRHVDVSPTMDAAFEVVSGLAGTFNGILFLIDPAVLAIKDHRWSQIDDERRPRPYTMSAWTWNSRVSEESLDIEKSVAMDERSRRFREVEADLEGL